MDELLVSKKDQICTVALNRPEVHNAFNPKLMNRLTEEFRQVGDDHSLRAVVLMGKGKSFCAGADINWMKQMKNYGQEENYADSWQLAQMLEAIAKCPLPVIGRIHGAALGGGVGLMAVCDYVLMVESAKWGLTEVNLGLVPAVIGPYVVEKIGTGQARAAFLTGQRYRGQRALEIGLAHEVFSSVSKLDQRVEEILRNIKNAGPKSIRLAKELIWMIQSFREKPEKLKDLTCQMISTQRASEEGQEGMMALLEKRSPKWGKGQ